MAAFRVGVLASGRGTDFQSLVDARDRGELGGELAVLVCNVPDAPVIERARRADVPVVVVDHRPFGKDREGFDRKVAQVLHDHRVDLVVFAGFMRIVTRTMVDAFPNRIINIHPSLLPSFPGTRAQRDALAHGVKVSGCTIHLVDASVDGGPIILQKAVPIHPDDTEQSLADRILVQEHIFLPLAVRLFAEDRIKVEGRRVRIEPAPPDLPSPA